MRKDTEKKNIKNAAVILRKGGVVAFPTETVYGLGADAYNPEAVARIFEIKRRPRFDPLIVHVSDLAQAKTLVNDFPEQARVLVNKFWSGPLTIVLPKAQSVPDIVTSGLPNVAVRMPEKWTALQLIKQLGRPLAAPSANPFGYISPTQAQHVEKQLGQEVDLILDGGSCDVGVESTVISLVEQQPQLLRAGGVPLEEIEQTIGAVEVSRRVSECPDAPGQLPQHYAPRTRLVSGVNADDFADDLRLGLLAFQNPTCVDKFCAVEILSENGDLKEAAANLFAVLNRLDNQSLDVIITEKVPDTGLGRAINDRLNRAAL